MMRCAIYCRLSREDEEKPLESESIQNQKALLTDYARSQNWEVVQLYCDEDYSGVDRDRPGFCAMLQQARLRTFQIILCKTQSRFTRDMELVERYIHGFFPLWGIRFVAIADHIDTNLQGNKKARQISGLVNEWYLEDLSENIRMVLDHKRRQGQHIGAFALYGYRKDPEQKGHLLIDPPAASVVQHIFQLASQGFGKQRIAALLNQEGLPNPTHYKQEQGANYGHGQSSRNWNRGTVGRILSNEMYLGTMVQGRNKRLSFKRKNLHSLPSEAWFRVEKTHEAIVDRQLFDAVQRLRSDHVKSDGTGQVHPLAGLIRCKNCGTALHKHSYTYKENRRSYLRCPQKSCACSVPLTSVLAFVEACVLDYIQKWYTPPATVQHAPAPVSAPSTAACVPCSRQAQYRAALEQLYLDKVAGEITKEQFHILSEALAHSLAGQEAPQACTPNASPQPTRAPWLDGAPLPRALLFQLMARVELSPRCGQEQGITIHWRF